MVFKGGVFGNQLGLVKEMRTKSLDGLMRIRRKSCIYRWIGLISITVMVENLVGRKGFSCFTAYGP